ncbi:MAG: MFS transporter [Proteobacteria bacterium]|nr:MFS transporter [Pseudomonadota bacterium]
MAEPNTGQESNIYRKWQIKIFIATWLAYAGYYFCRKAFYVVKGDLAIAFDLNTIDLANLGTAYLVSYMIGQYSSTYVGGKLGPKLLLLVGMGISIGCNFAFGNANGFWTVMLFLALNGLAQGTGWPGCIGSLAFWFKRKQRGSVLGVWSTCYQLGSVMATSFAAFMLGQAGWRWSFFGASLVLLIIWFVVLVLHPGRPEDVNLPQLEDDEDGDGGQDRRGLGWSRKTLTAIVLMGIIYFTIKFLRYALWSWAPYFLSQNYHLETDQAGYYSTVFDLLGFAGVIFAGFASDKIFKGRRSFLSFAMLVAMTLSFVAMYALGSSSLFYFTLSMGFAGFMLYGPDSLLSGVGAIDMGSKRGALAAAGIINGTGSIGPIFQEQLIGWMYVTYDRDLTPIFVLLVLVAAVGTALTFLLWMMIDRNPIKK